MWLHSNQYVYLQQTLHHYDANNETQLLFPEVHIPGIRLLLYERRNKHTRQKQAKSVKVTYVWDSRSWLSTTLYVIPTNFSSQPPAWESILITLSNRQNVNFKHRNLRVKLMAVGSFLEEQKTEIIEIQFQVTEGHPQNWKTENIYMCGIWFCNVFNIINIEHKVLHCIIHCK